MIEVISLVIFSIVIVIVLLRGRKKMPQKGDIVYYTDRFDSRQDESPNISPALVVDVNQDSTLDLVVFFMNGSFWRTSVAKGDATQRNTWHPKP